MADQPHTSLQELLRRLAPGTELREGIERIIQQRTGALVVVGDDTDVDPLCTGGFLLRDTTFSAQRLAELAKMDGAIVLASNAERITRANVHLIPDPTIPTAETGTRHRTAERMARQTGIPVLSISEGRKLAVVFLADLRHELESPVTVLPKANQMVQTLDRFRRRLDVAEEVLTRREIEGMVSYRSVVAIIQRAEIIRRLGADIEDLTIELGEGGNLISFQEADLTLGVEALADVVISDYAKGRNRSRGLKALASLSMADVHDPEKVAETYRFESLEGEARPAGYRVLGGVPGLPSSVKNSIVARFKNLQRLLEAPAEKLGTVEGVGPLRARQIRLYLNQLQQEIGLLVHGEVE